MAKPKQYQFTTQPRVVVTPIAETLFMSLAEINEISGVFGGKLLFTNEALDTTVKVKIGKGKETRSTFRDVIDGMLDEAYQELTNDGKKVTKAEKIKENIDREGNGTGKYEMTIKNMEQPRILNKDRTVDANFTTKISNGSTMKAQLYLKPYTMQGKVGITAYVNTALLLDVIEYSSGDMFDEDDFDGTSVGFDDVEPTQDQLDKADF